MSTFKEKLRKNSWALFISGIIIIASQPAYHYLSSKKEQFHKNTKSAAEISVLQLKQLRMAIVITQSSIHNNDLPKGDNFNETMDFMISKNIMKLRTKHVNGDGFKVTWMNNKAIFITLMNVNKSVCKLANTAKSNDDNTILDVQNVTEVDIESGSTSCIMINGTTNLTIKI